MSQSAAPLLIRLTRRHDTGAVLHCERADGTVTWQRQDGRQGRFFPFHDLIHYAVETVLGFEQGFFGLVAGGWDIEDTTGKGRRGPLPAETVMVEQLVGLLMAEQTSPGGWSAAEFNAQIQRIAGTQPPGTLPVLSDADLARVRDRVRDLHSRWLAIAPGESLELRFPEALVA